MEWLTDAAIASGKRRLLLADAGDRVYAEDLAEELGQARWWRGDASYALDRAARISALGTADVAAAWRTYVRDAPKIRVYVKPERVPAWIRMFGWLYPLFS
jgi:predicted Zn-dependent peptidase